VCESKESTSILVARFTLESVEWISSASWTKLARVMVVLSKANDPNDPNDREEINDLERHCTGYKINYN
jgi:hypothetical protein